MGKLTAAEEKQSGGQEKTMGSSQNAHDAHHPSDKEDDHAEGQQHDERRLHVCKNMYNNNNYYIAIIIIIIVVIVHNFMSRKMSIHKTD